jgi:membrane protein DedA with SNARE-associated domain
MGVVCTYFGEHISKAGSEGEQQIESMKHGGSGGRPPRNSRGTQVLLCTFAGVVVGCTAGVVIGLNMMDAGGAVMGSIFGFVIGGIIGSFVGEYLKKRKYRKLDRLAEKSEIGNKQGPLLS